MALAVSSAPVVAGLSLSLKPCAAVRAAAPSLFLGNRLAASYRSEASKARSFVVRATSEEVEESEFVKKSKEVLLDAKDKWDAVEDKSTVVIYGGGALVALWLSSTIVSAVNSIPLLPKFLELVGTVYSGWFIYRYLLFKSSRKELSLLIDDLKAKITDKAN
ncbi:hypothetical protein CLOM_g10107 [Closterium sp. NIES-68]|nr:hypothetical protein CLOM_g10107 [Closterium sp. NIES-68]GJP72663.1 hypothetical protein CLOP_g3429 [Closterium sp. NIES-67]